MNSYTNQDFKDGHWNLQILMAKSHYSIVFLKLSHKSSADFDIQSSIITKLSPGLQLSVWNAMDHVPIKLPYCKANRIV